MADLIPEKLDEMTLDFFEKFETLQMKREALCKAMRDGYLNLSQARYSMGNKAVGELQYNSRMQASVLVLENKAMKFELQTSTPDKLRDQNNEDDEEKSLNCALRKRKGNLSPKVNDDICKSMEDNLAFGVQDIELNAKEMENTKNGIQCQDPLKWFGVLVPKCLRTGQNDFKTSVDLCCDLVNLENELKYLIKKYRDLKALKCQ